jgi:hypothetical protein
VQIPCVTQSTLTSKNQTTIPKAVIEAFATFDKGIVRRHHPFAGTPG